MDGHHLNFDETDVEPDNTIFEAVMGEDIDFSDDDAEHWDYHSDSGSSSSTDNDVHSWGFEEDQTGVYDEGRLIEEAIAVEEPRHEPASSDHSRNSSVVPIGGLGVPGSYPLLYDFPEFNELPSSESPKVYMPEFRQNPRRDGELTVGFTFPSKLELKRAVQEWSVNHRVHFTVHKSGPKIFLLHCAKKDTHGCKWRLRAIPRLHEVHWTVTAMGEPHTCAGEIIERDNRHLNRDFIALRVRDVIKGRLTLSPAAIRNSMKEMFGMHITYKKAWKARQRALEMLFGDYKESFALLPKYFDIVIRTNPGTVVHWDRSLEPNGEMVVRRVFWAFGPAIKGFAHCPPVLCVDGTHLYGKYKGVLLVAIAMDAQHNLLPVAFALVESENNSSWDWFMTCLLYGVTNAKDLCIISDRHNGIINAMGKHPWTLAHHRFCSRHVCSNFNSRVRCLSKKELLGRIAYTHQEKKFWILWRELRTLLGDDHATKEWLDEMPLTKWALAFDYGGRRYQSMTTNAAEVFNRVLKGGRDLPVTAMVQLTFQRTNKYFVRHRLTHTQWCAGDIFVPRVKELIAKKVEKAARHKVTKYDVNREGVYSVRTRAIWYDRHGRYKTSDGNNTHTVNLSKMTCSCGKLERFRYPCSHVLAVTSKMGLSYSPFVDPKFRVSEYAQTWDPTFAPIPDAAYWPQFTGPTHVPANTFMRSSKGRPVKNRRKNEMDHGVRRASSSAGAGSSSQDPRPIMPTHPPGKKTCSKCKQLGHNRRRCPNQASAE